MATTEEIEAIVTAVSRSMTEAVLRLWESDPHQFGRRPCSTCRSVSAIVGRKFGCVARAAEAPNDR